MYDRGEEKKCFDDFKEQDSGAEEVISSNVLPALMDFIGSDEFRSQVDRFMSKYASLFESGRKAEGKSGDDVIQEWSHEHKQAFDRYQDTLEQLFTTFAERQKAPLSEIYKCCQDTGMYWTPWMFCLFL